MDSLPITLPAAPPPSRRPPLPFIAAVVPVAAGIVLWLVSGSLYALCFAALGPLMLVASVLDGARSRRRERRTNDAELEAGWGRAERDLLRRHDEARERLWHRYPDAMSCLVRPPLRGTESPDATTEVVVGRGSVPSGIRTSGGEGERAREFAARCATLTGAPIKVPLGQGLCLRGPRPVVAAAARALLAQLSLRFSPVQLSVLADGLDSWGITALPSAGAVRRGALRLALSEKGGAADADAVIWLLSRSEDVPEGISTVIDVEDPLRASMRTPDTTTDLGVEAMSRAQFAAVMHERMAGVPAAEEVPARVALAGLDQKESPDGLPATIGIGERGEVVLDIVQDGPHAIVTGMTGTGKSELLVSWVAAIAHANGPERVSFVLADFKGGTAFDPLRALPQVAAVITDLDEEGARRGVSSLTAELRRREALLARAGARDVSEVAMPRLIVVVDEFAALLQEHPDLGAVFTDVAARGRALGMHLILGTQRASGVIRDALATNCPLRIGLRVVDAADSRLVIGSAAAAEIAGGRESRGLGFVRRPQDTEPCAVRVARTEPADLDRIVRRWSGSAAPHSPWLPALPARLPLKDVVGDARRGDLLVMGRADDPSRQRQPEETLRIGVDRGIAVLGAAGSGRTTALRALAAQRTDACWVPRDLEGAGDLVCGWADGVHRPPPLVLCDDLDHLANGFPPEHAQRFLQAWEQVIRQGSGATFVLTASRASGGVARVLDALPRRALLRMTSRVEHLAAGGESSGYLRERPPGRARIGEREVQLAWVEETPSTHGPDPSTPLWTPTPGLTGLVTSSASAVAARLRSAYPQREVVLLGDPAVGHTDATLIVGDAESWQRHPQVWQRARIEGTVLLRVENPADLRLLAGIRELPPFALPHAGRAWMLRGEDGPRRVVIPSLTSPAQGEIRNQAPQVSAADDAPRPDDPPPLRRRLRREAR